MPAYREMDVATPGLIFGLKKRIGTFAVKEEDTFSWGDPVFVAEGVPNVAEMGDNTNSSLVFAGVAIISQRSYVDSEGEYPGEDAMNVLEEGQVWVPVPAALAGTGISNRAAYVIDDPENADYGLFTTDDAWYTISGGFRSEPILVDGQYIAILETRGMYPGASET